MSTSPRIWRKPSDTDMTPYRDPILDRWASGLSVPEIAAEISQLSNRQIANFLRYEGLKRDEARDPRIDPARHLTAKMARRKPEPAPVTHGLLLCPELGIERVETRRRDIHPYENAGNQSGFVTVSLPRLRFLEGIPA